MHSLLQDGWHVLTHVDGRLWRTMGALVARPGRLTREYFLDHRERYIPPVRLYLILSLLFFAFVGVGQSGNDATSSDGQLIQLQPAEDCSKLTGDGAIARWIRRTCDRVAADRGASTSAALRGNLPRMMFLFLPVLAGAMKLLYWRPRRLYVEHLVFFLHTHSAMYLAILAMVLAGWLGRLLPSVAGFLGWLQAALWFYMVWYLYRALRVMYEQRRRRTIGKFVAIGLVYFVCMMAMLALTAMFSVLTAN